MTALLRIQGSSTYLLGSLHLTNIDSFQLPQHIESAFRGSSRVIFETNLDGKPDFSLFQIPAGRTLSDILPPAIYGATLNHWNRLGLLESDLQRIVPIAAMVTLQVNEAGRNGYYPALGIDRYFWQRATREGKKKLTLESLADQFGKLAQLPMDEQISNLDYLVSAEDARISELAAMLLAWKTGDMDAIEQYCAKLFSRWPKTYEILLSERNRNWLPSVHASASSRESTFIVVGALHLCGPTGLPELLRKDGLSLIREDA